VVVVVVVMFGNGCKAQQGSNLLTNPDFEDSFNYFPSGWNKSGSGSNVMATYRHSTSQVHSGSGTQQLAITSLDFGANAQLWQIVPSCSEPSRNPCDRRFFSATLTSNLDGTRSQKQNICSKQLMSLNPMFSSSTGGGFLPLLLLTRLTPSCSPSPALCLLSSYTTASTSSTSQRFSRSFVTRANNTENAKTTLKSKTKDMIAAKQQELKATLSNLKDEFLEEAKKKKGEEEMVVYEPIRKPNKPKYPREVRQEEVQAVAQKYHERWQKERLEEEFVKGYVEARTRAEFLSWKTQETQRLEAVKEERRKHLAELTRDRLAYKEAREEVLERFRLAKLKLEERARLEFLQLLREDAVLWTQHPSELKNRPFYTLPSWQFDKTH
jgi:hypothetical protein